MSAGEAKDITPHSPILDLQAVVEDLSLGQFDILAHDCGGPIALAYAANHPDRVSSLVLWHALIRLADYFYSPLVETLLPLIESDWDLYTTTMIRAYAGWTKSRDPSVSAALFRASLRREVYKELMARADDFDASKYLSLITARTLVLHRRGYDSIPVSTSQTLASTIPNAELCIVEGKSNYLNDDERNDSGMDAVRAFLGFPDESKPGRNEPGLSRREREILVLVANGLHNREIATELALSIHTVERHLANIYAKIGARSRVEAAAYALNHLNDSSLDYSAHSLVVAGSSPATTEALA
jgi:DNA-binding CsgD family transcriptional regulator